MVVLNRNVLSELYPIDYITYEGAGPEVKKSITNTKKMGFHILKVTPDNYNVPEEVKAGHAGFKHMKEITLPKILRLKQKKNIKGFFIAEGDLCLDKDYNFETFLKEKHTKPIWLGYKKQLSNYIVGNFLIYFPIEYINKLDYYFKKQTRLIYSDRFFTKLFDIKFLKLNKKSIATEIEHYSNVLYASKQKSNGVRKSKCHIGYV